MATGKIIQADKIQGLADVPNFLSNPNGLLNTSGWAEGSYTAGARPTGSFTASSGAGAFTIGRTTTNPLGMTGTSLVFTKSSGNQQGRAVETSFALPLSYRAKVLQIEIDYILNSTGFLPGDNLTSGSLIWYCAFSNDNGTTYTLAEPSSFKMLSDSQTISDKLTASIQSPYDATHMKLIAYIPSTDPFTWSVKCIASVSPSEYVYGTPITDWQSYTPTYAGLGTGGLGSNFAYYRRVGSNIEVRTRAVKDGSNGSGSAEVTLTLPSGLTVDTSKLPLGDTSNIIGNGWIGIATNATLSVFYKSTSSNLIYFLQNDGSILTGADVSLTAALWSTFSVPILGWSSSVQMSDSADTRVVDLIASNSNAQTLTANVTSLSFTAIKDSHGTWSGTEYTVPSAGDYDVKINYYATQAGATALYVLINGTEPYGRLYLGVGSTTQPGSGSIIVPNLKNGDKISIRGDSSQTLTATNRVLSISRISGPQAIAATETIACRYATSAGNSVGTSATLITYATKSFDTHGAYNKSSGLFTAPAYGLYRVSCMAFTANVALATNNSFQGYIYKNGVLYSTLFVYNGNGATTNAVGGGDDIVELLAGETISIRALASVATNLSTDARYNYITVERIG